MSEVIPECAAGFNDLRTSVALIERDIIVHARVQDKLSEAVEKIQEMNANLCKMISLHELKHDSAEKYHIAIDEDVKELTTRIDTLFSSSRKQTPQDHTKADKTIKELEKWKYVLMGAVFMLGWMLAHINWQVLVSLFK